MFSGSKCNSDVKCCSSRSAPDENGCCEFDRPTGRPQHFSVTNFYFPPTISTIRLTFTFTLIDKPALLGANSKLDPNYLYVKNINILKIQIIWVILREIESPDIFVATWFPSSKSLFHPGCPAGRLVAGCLLLAGREMCTSSTINSSPSWIQEVFRTPIDNIVLT